MGIVGGLALVGLVGCGDDGDTKDTETGDSGGEAFPFLLAADPLIAFPFTSVGTTMPAVNFHVSNLGNVQSAGQLVVESITEGFEIRVNPNRLDANEVRDASAVYMGPPGQAAIATGEAILSCDGQQVHIALSAVQGDVDLPATTWTEDEWGFRTTVPMPSAPFPDGSASYDDPSVLIFYPHGLSDRGNLGVVTHLHGHNATIAEVEADQHLAEQLAISGRDAVFILPQGPVEAADGDFGKLDEEGGFYNLVRDVVSVLYRDGVIQRPTIGPVAVSSHSGGYNATANIIEGGGLPLTAVHLFDSLYGRSDTYEGYAVGGGVLRSNYTSGGGTDDENEALAAALLAAGLDVRDRFDDDTLAATPVTIGLVASDHGATMSDELNAARWLAASGLPHNPGVPPVLLASLADGDVAHVSWRADAGGLVTVALEGSEDGENWTEVARTTATEVDAPLYPWFRVRAVDEDWGDSRPSDHYGATGEDWLVVDGFDRVFGGSWTAPEHLFAAMLGQSLGAPFSVAANEAVAGGEAKLSDYLGVLWMLGDESTADVTFDTLEQTAIRSYLDRGGKLIVSGSEVGYATGSWLEDTLHASYVADDAGTNEVEGWTLGVTYPEDYPDVLAGDEVVWTYANGMTAAVGWNRQVVVVGFALETLGEADRAAALADLRAWLDGG